ncbi:hypothetical protein LCGC14_0887360, partial [marine sediment metagenome]
MKILEILEARYYGRHSVDAVYKRLVDRANIQTDSQHKLMSYIYDVEMGEGLVRAKVYLYDVDSEQHAISQAERLLHLHGIPYTDIRGGMHVGTNRWILVMTYKPTVTEAKYYQRHSAEDVKDRLEKTARKHNKWENVRVLEAWLGSKDDLGAQGTPTFVFAHLYVVNADTKQDAENEIRLHLKKFGIPYTRIQDLESLIAVPAGTPRSSWEATLVYDPS